MTTAPETTTAPAALIDVRDNIMVITLNRPDARNAVNEEMCLLVGDALTQAEEDPEVRVVVLTGSGDKAFCAGADLKALARGERIIPEGREAWGLAGYVGHAISKPTIAAVNGTALGGGTELVLASDLAVSSETAIFGLPEVARGLVAGAGGAFRLLSRIPQSVALEMLFTGEPISAQRALDLHLVNRVVPADQVLATALELAAKIAANAPLAVQAHKQIALNQGAAGERPSEQAGWDATTRMVQVIVRSEDAKEGPRAFAEKRQPVWTGR